MHLTQIARWPGKSPVTPGAPAHPAAYHMLDVAAVAEELLADHPRRALYCLLIALHDLGKIGEVFRRALSEGVVQDRRHWEVTEAWLHDPQILALLLQHLGGRIRRCCPWLRQLQAITAGLQRPRYHAILMPCDHAPERRPMTMRWISCGPA